MLSVGEVAILASAGGLGKSCLTLALAVEAATAAEAGRASSTADHARKNLGRLERPVGPPGDAAFRVKSRSRFWWIAVALCQRKSLGDNNRTLSLLNKNSRRTE